MEKITTSIKFTIVLFAFGLFSLFVITGCYKDGVSKSTEGNDINVELLFEKDGVKVYRFVDGGRFHYFTTKGETISTQTESHHEHDENISSN